MRTQLPSPKGAQPPNFRPLSVVAKRLDRLRCHATLCLMGTQLPPEKGHTRLHPIFGPCLLWPNGLMDEDATWYGSRPRHRPHSIRRGPSCPRGWHSSPPLFAHVYCGRGRTSQLLLSSCIAFHDFCIIPNCGKQIVLVGQMSSVSIAICVLGITLEPTILPTELSMERIIRPTFNVWNGDC